MAVILKDDRGDLAVVQLSNLEKNKCKNFYKYKGLMMPRCGCLPCMEVYLQKCESNSGSRSS